MNKALLLRSAIIAGVLAASTVDAQSLSTFDRKEKTAAPKLACRDLRALTGYEFSVDSAVAVGESCVVQGLAQPEAAGYERAAQQGLAPDKARRCGPSFTEASR